MVGSLSSCSGSVQHRTDAEMSAECKNDRAKQ
jgi:hypothetical protein